MRSFRSLSDADATDVRGVCSRFASFAAATTAAAAVTKPENLNVESRKSKLCTRAKIEFLRAILDAMELLQCSAPLPSAAHNSIG